MNFGLDWIKRNCMKREKKKIFNINYVPTCELYDPVRIEFGKMYTCVVTKKVFSKDHPRNKEEGRRRRGRSRRRRGKQFVTLLEFLRDVNIFVEHVAWTLVH